MPRRLLCGLLLAGLFVGCGSDEMTNTLPPEPGLEKAPTTKKRVIGNKQPLPQVKGLMEIPK